MSLKTRLDRLERIKPSLPSEPLVVHFIKHRPGETPGPLPIPEHLQGLPLLLRDGDRLFNPVTEYGW